VARVFHTAGLEGAGTALYVHLMSGSPSQGIQRQLAAQRPVSGHVLTDTPFLVDIKFWDTYPATGWDRLEVGGKQ
jgi:hypothetical protein